MDRAAMLARQHGAEVIVVHVLEPTPDVLDAQTVRFSPRAPRDRLVDIVRRDLSGDLRDAGERVTIRIEEGNPADVILRIAKEVSCDVIVTGVARNETLGRFTLGKTVDFLLRASDVPLLIVTNRARKPYHNVVVATDFSEASQHALEAAAAIFSDRKLTVFHAYDALGAYNSRDAKRRQAELRLWAHDDCMEFLERVDLPAETRARLSVLLEWGDPDNLLRELAQTDAVDLVVLGTRRRGVLLQAFLGSVAKRIVALLPCDALVVGRPSAREVE
jgi:nucleotide-binding universal stress UspA family protein